MTEYGMACLVRSLAGHDKGNYYIIVREDAHYVYLAENCRQAETQEEKARAVFPQAG